jgi:hypothetical protein
VLALSLSPPGFSRLDCAPAPSGWRFFVDRHHRCISRATLSLQGISLISLPHHEFILLLRGCCILDDFSTPTSALPMQIQTTLPDSAVALMAYVDDAGWTEHAELVVQIMMSSVHPDIESSLATTVFLPRSVRTNVAGFLSEMLIDGLSDEQRNEIFSWTQCWALASLDQ